VAFAVRDAARNATTYPRERNMSAIMQHERVIRFFHGSCLYVRAARSVSVRSMLPGTRD
jgi:hypothetical protein